MKLVYSLLVGFLLSPLALASSKPNIILILVDDMPWYGTPVRMEANNPASAMAFRNMPNVEKLAAQGMTFSHGRAAAGLCAPSRCSIMTGMMTARHLFSGNGGFGKKTDGKVEYLTRGKDASHRLLQPEPQGNIRFPSYGDLLKSSGYATAHFGKWHIYGGGPEKHGFDESDGETDNKQGQAEPDLSPKAGLPSHNDPKLMFGIAQRGVNFIERQVKAGKPFVLQLSHYATHAKFHATKETLVKYEKNPVFASILNPSERRDAIMAAAMSEDLDTSIGMVLTKLKELEIENNTLIVFTSDNGYEQWNEEHRPLRGAKWWLWENGLRVPLIVCGPGVKAGSRSDANVSGYDWLPTFADFAGVPQEAMGKVDGVSMKPILLGHAQSEEFFNRDLYFHYPHYRISPPCSAVVSGQMKLLHFYEWPESLFLYDLSRDLGETQNLAASKPELAAKMQASLIKKLESVGGFFPKPNPEADLKAKRYDPSNLDSEVQQSH